MKHQARYNFLIITPGRSGSEHLSETLNHLEDLVMEGEIFNRTNNSSESFNAFLKENALNNSLNFLFNREKISSWPLNLPLSFLIKKFLKGNKNSSLLRGFKLTLDQLSAYPFVLKWLLRHHVKVIYLTRKDKIALTLSLIQARTTSIYHVKKKQTIEPISIPPDHAKKQLKATLRAEKRILDRLKTKNIAYLELSYEELFSQYQEKVNELRSYLKLPPQEVKVYSTLVKQNPQDLKEWIRNLPEIEAELKPILNKFSDE